MATLDDLKNFNIEEATVSLWVFKSSSSGGVPSFSGRWIGLTDNLDGAIKEAISNSLGVISETIDYDILAQNNESSALTIPTDETYAAMIAQKAADETAARKVARLKQIENIAFYAIKLVNDHGSLFAIRKADASWSTKKSKSIIKVFYADDELDLEKAPSFNISSHFDFYVLNDSIFISSKPSFESVLSYRQGHVEAFGTLQAEQEFAHLFADTAPIVEFVGTNKIQLRRAIAIQQKGHYKDPAFMANLKKHYKVMNLDIQFDDAGRIVPTLESCRHIFQALLDHRLDSRLSEKMYYVQNTAPVS